jgi:transketolase
MSGFTFNMRMMSSRDAYGTELARIGERNEKIVVLTADCMRSNKTGDFREKCPDRFYNTGIAEANMMGIAAGMALEGMIPFVSTFAAFASMRACEQLRTDICYPNLPVRIVATHSGLTSGCGPTHYAQEDLAITRSMINLTVICPGDPNQIGKILDASMTHDGPIYIRIGRGAEQVVYENDYEYRIGKAIVAKEGGDAAIIATGVALGFAYEAAKRLELEGTDVRVIDMHTVKPIDREAVVDSAKTGVVITVEDHNTNGGLGSAVADVLAEEGIGCRFRKLGIPEEYAAVGLLDDLYNKYGYNADGIHRTVKNIFR